MPHSSSSRDCSVGASGPRLRPVQTIPLQSSTSPGGLCWSAGSGGTLAVATRKGALAIEMVPGARGATEEAAAPAADVGCNLDMVMVTRCLDEQNPYLQDVGVDRNALMEQVSASEGDKAAGVWHAPLVGPPAHRRLDRILWAPRGSLGQQQQEEVLLALTDDHWLRAYKSSESDVVIFDFSQDLYNHLKDRKWKDCVGFRSLFPISGKKADRLISDRWARTYAQSVTCLDCILLAAGGGGARRPLLLAGNKLGQIVGWDLSTPRPMLCLLHDCGVRHLQLLTVHLGGDPGRPLVFAGFSDGTLKVLEISWAHGEGMKVVDRGYLWSEKDMVTPRAVRVARYESQEMQLLVAKGSFLLALDLLERTNQDSSVVVRQWKAAPPFSSPLVDILPWEQEKLDTSSFLVFPELGRPKRVVLSGGGGGKGKGRMGGGGGGGGSGLSLEICEVGDLPPELSSSSSAAEYRTVSVGWPGEGDKDVPAVVAVLQDICVYYDHLVLRNPARVVLLTPLSRSMLAAVILDETEEAKPHHLEVFRTLSRQEVESAQVETTPPLIKETADLLNRHLKSTATKVGSKRRLLWMSGLLAALSEEVGDDQMQGWFRDRSNALTQELLVDRALRRLRQRGLSRDWLSSTAGFLLRVIVQDQPDIAREINAMRIPRYDWRCVICGCDAVEWGLDYVRCSGGESGGGGHCWPLCTRTQRVCDDGCSSLVRCRWCSAVAMTERQRPGEGEEEDEGCVLCGGPLTLTGL